MANAFLKGFIRTMVFTEIIPSLSDGNPELADFANATFARFHNPYVAHSLESISLNSISKFRVRLLPSMVDYYENQGALPSHLVFAFAGLLQLYSGTFQGKELAVNDAPEPIEKIQQAWGLPDLVVTVDTLLAMEELWGRDLGLMTGLAPRITLALQMLRKYDVPTAFENYQQQLKKERG